MFTLKTLNAWGAEKDYCKQQEKIKLIEKPLMSTEQSRNSFESRTSYRVFRVDLGPLKHMGVVYLALIEASTVPSCYRGILPSTLHFF